MSSTFGGFSEEDLQRIKSNQTGQSNGSQINTSNIKKLDKLGGNLKKPIRQYKLPLQKQGSDDAIDSIDFQNCKLSIRTPTSLTYNITDNVSENDPNKNIIEANENETNKNITDARENLSINMNEDIKNEESINTNMNDNQNKESNDTEVLNERNDIRKYSTDSTPDIVRGAKDYTENELAAHKAKLEELQLKQKIMEEQNKKRKEMLAKALADRTKQTEEEVMRLEKIKKELQVLDGQFTQDVAVLRKRIDQACISYADAEKHYLKVEKEFLQAKISLQKEREKKELLTEHLCALITHNETRKAQKLETLMLELATDKKREIDDAVSKSMEDITKAIDNEEPIIVDGVDQRTGKIVELPIGS